MPINEAIRDKEVRLINEDGEMLGIVSGKDALSMASQKELDLVKIAPQASPPVCKIMDYGKHLFDQAKKDKEARKNQKMVEVKEVRLSPTIDEHDFGFKMKNASKFLKDGNKVKVSVRFRGREMNYTQQGEKVLLKFAEGLDEFGSADRRPKLEGKTMTMILSPK